jgi:hypothetical protein
VQSGFDRWAGAMDGDRGRPRCSTRGPCRWRQPLQRSCLQWSGGPPQPIALCTHVVPSASASFCWRQVQLPLSAFAQMPHDNALDLEPAFAHLGRVGDSRELGAKPAAGTKMIPVDTASPEEEGSEEYRQGSLEVPGSLENPGPGESWQALAGALGGYGGDGSHEQSDAEVREHRPCARAGCVGSVLLLFVAPPPPQPRALFVRCPCCSGAPPRRRRRTMTSIRGGRAGLGRTT